MGYLPGWDKRMSRNRILSPVHSTTAVLALLFVPLRFLGSLKVAVTLLVAIAGVLAWGTLYEARFGTAAVQRFVYRSVWFQGILVFLAVNLGVAAFLRFPWKRKHLPFLLAHLGIILILTGGILGGRLGREGRLIIPEGKISDTLQMERNVLVIHQPNPGIHEEFATRFETTAWDHAPHALFEVPLEGGPFQVVVDKYYPNADRQEEIRDGGDRENPAVQVALSFEGHQDSIWLLARDRDRFGARWGQAHVLFLELDSEKALRQMLGRGGRVLPPSSIILLRIRSPGKLMAVMTGPSGKQTRLNPVEVGKAYKHPALGYEFHLLDFYPNARVEASFLPRDDEVKAEALHLVARQGDRVVPAWAGLQDPVALPFGKHPVVVEYRPAAERLPFSVRLLDFRKTDYPGTEMAAAFESDVELTDPDRGVTLKKTIRMNNPLKYRGYSLFQSSFVPGAAETTILSVRKDPGTPLVYAGFLIVLSGVVLLFTSRARTT